MGKLPRDPNAVTVQLIVGTSDLRQRTFSGTSPIWLQVGNDVHADWQIQGFGVAPAQCELLWDGHALFIQDRLRLGTNVLGGARVDGWTQLTNQPQVYLAQACVRIVGPQRAPGERPDPVMLRWVQGQMLARQGGPLAEEPSSVPPGRQRG